MILGVQPAVRGNTDMITMTVLTLDSSVPVTAVRNSRWGLDI